MALTGVGLVIVGVLHEALSNPIRPVLSMFGIVPLALGGAIVTAFAVSRIYAAGMVLYYILIVTIWWYSLFSARGSLLPVCCFAGTYNLARAAILYQEQNP
jgi:hypothetical protein